MEDITGKGPILPVEIAKHINTNILMASARLSEIKSNGKIKISHVKVGGSPLYYLPGQEPQLQRFADNLHEKEKRAYDLLSQKKVLREKDLEPLTRVALRAIKDYSVPLQVNFKDNSEIFWRWYLLTNKEAEELIKPFFSEPKKEIKQPAEQENKEIAKAQEMETKLEEAKKEKIPSKETQTKIEEQKKEMTPLKKKKTIKTEKDDFLDKTGSYLTRNDITTLSKEIIRKGEIDFIVQVPSAVGALEYYCKAKNKKKINDADLASAFAQGQLRKLPVLFITNGELTKRAQEMLQKDFKGMSIKKI